MMFQRLMAGVVFLLLAPSAQAQDPLAVPQGDVLLTVSGAIAQTNAPGQAEFDRSMLVALPSTRFSTTTIWTEGTQDFEGVALAHLAEALGFQGSLLLARAANDYEIAIPLSDISEDAPIIAYLRNGAPMSLRDKGPLWVVYPYDLNPKYKSETAYSRSIWQLDRLEVVD